MQAKNRREAWFGFWWLRILQHVKFLAHVCCLCRMLHVTDKCAKVAPRNSENDTQHWKTIPGQDMTIEPLLFALLRRLMILSRKTDELQRKFAFRPELVMAPCMTLSKIPGSSEKFAHSGFSINWMSNKKEWQNGFMHVICSCYLRKSIPLKEEYPVKLRFYPVSSQGTKCGSRILSMKANGKGTNGNTPILPRQRNRKLFTQVQVRSWWLFFKYRGTLLVDFLQRGAQ